jgi:hypothetical protein
MRVIIMSYWYGLQGEERRKLQGTAGDVNDDDSDDRDDDDFPLRHHDSALNAVDA